MDPKATLIDLLEAVHSGDAGGIVEAAEYLEEWFKKGGFGSKGEPSPVTNAAEVALAAIREMD